MSYGLDSSYPLERIRADFPILAQMVRGKRLAYLDNAATTQKPRAVIEAISRYYETSNANVHRAVHELAERATTQYEGARDRIARFFNAQREEVVFTRGSTEAINLVAYSFLRPLLKAGDEILVTGMEHHSNIVPWQLVAAERGASVLAAPVLDDGSLDFEGWKKLLSERTRFIAVVHVSNTLGTVNPVAEIIREAQARGIPVLVDGAQAVAHLPVDFAALGADFYTLSAHKLYGPTGFGCLLGRRERLEAMPPWHGGGDMIKTVSFAGSTWAEPPYRFEAGTPDMAGAIGLAAALDYVEALGLEQIAAQEHRVLEYATPRLREIPGLRLIGTATGKGGILSFVLEGAHAQDVGSILDMEGVAVRTGHHCTMPLMARYGVSATTRASLACYNGEDDIDQLVAALHKAVRLLRS
ncbi:cysteine desulfurase [Stagnimonas aquatica]|uniref:Probable cysteine desulfurase n=1 Tax=Stagnimonas aquatica TaxID=2689987 RepID=A0A3N0VA28_9GAMM|nr:cysteine desulfurase [Stagnimonas aquatica]ROH89464.1 cysteine desulfurase [Stagnimonas aquatica]